MQLAPSDPGYEFSAADLSAAAFSPEELGRVVRTFQQQSAQTPGGLQVDPITALLAALLKVTRKGNCVFLPFAFSFAAFNSQQLLQTNPNRAYLLIQNTGNADLYALFEETDKTLQDFSAAADQATLTGRSTRSVKIVAGGNYEPLAVPTNAVTLFCLANATRGLVIEG